MRCESSARTSNRRWQTAAADVIGDRGKVCGHAATQTGLANGAEHRGIGIGASEGEEAELGRQAATKEGAAPTTCLREIERCQSGEQAELRRECAVQLNIANIKSAHVPSRAPAVHTVPPSATRTTIVRRIAAWVALQPVLFSCPLCTTG